jgi:hypothetical protein
MRITRCVKITCLAAAVFAGPAQLCAQARRCGEIGVGASGQVRTTVAPARVPDPAGHPLRNQRQQ